MVSNLSRTAKKLKKAHVVFRRDPSGVKKVLASNGFDIVEDDPDFVVCFGGDGTVLYGERIFPEIPKLIIKTSKTCRMYDYSLKNLTALLSMIKTGNYQIHSEMKLETEVKGKKLVGLNEIQIHPRIPIYAIRFSLSTNGKEYSDLIGDGVIIAPPFGSTGYYAATGGRPFENGIGISFNNLHRRKERSINVSENHGITLRISRGPAWLFADNNEDFVELNAGDTVTIKKSESTANFIYFPRL